MLGPEDCLQVKKSFEPGLYGLIVRIVYELILCCDYQDFDISLKRLEIR